MPYTFYNGSIGIQTVGAVILTADQVTDDMLAVQIVNEGALLACTTLGALRTFVNQGAGLYNDGGVLGVSDPAGWPTDSGGTPGSIWTNGGVASVVPGGTPVAALPVIFGFITARELLMLGGLGLPTTSPMVGSLQLWNLGGEILIA